ncbi:MAG TPA: DUF2231 domain-containing protein [Steroidobacteraceae bacterium]|nr:DUF2231 domain-containing protein [Steroidobacteraceae bacterium]
MNRESGSSNPRSTASIAGHPLHPMVVPFPIASFAGALATDIAFASSGNPFWADASQWLLGVGVVMALVAAVGGFVDFLGDARIRALAPAWRHMIGNLALVVIEAFNFFIRLGNPADAVVPLGVALSAIGVLLLLFNGWQGWEMVYRHRVGIADRADR